MKKKIILTIAFLISLLPMLLNQYGGMKGVQEICSIISITIIFFILWSVEMSRETDGSLFSIIILTIEFVIVQLPFLLPIF